LLTATGWFVATRALSRPIKKLSMVQRVAERTNEATAPVSVLSPLGEGTGGRLLHSSNAVDWSESAVGGSGGLNSVAYGSGTFVAAGNGCGLFGCAGATLWSSKDGIAWADRSLEAVPRNLRCVAYGNGAFVAGGNSGTILQSDKFGPRLAPFAWLPNGPLTFTLFGEPGQNYRIEASSDLANWLALTNFVSATGTNQFTDPAAPSFNRKFYRAVTP
jgi:hypothetical protein